MPKLSRPKYLNNNFIVPHRLILTFKLLAKHKDTAHLIDLKSFKKGDYLVEEQQLVHGVFFVIEGKVKVYSTGANNKRNILRFVSKGDFVGLSSLNSTHYWASAVVLERVKVYFIDLEHLHFILNNNIKLSLLLINKLAVKLRHYEIRQNHLTLFPAPERIIDALLLIAYKFGETSNDKVVISTGTARKDIANFSNTSVELTIRTLSKLNSQKHISLQGKTIIINEKVILLNRLKQFCRANNLPEELNFCYPI